MPRENVIARRMFISIPMECLAFAGWATQHRGKVPSAALEIIASPVPSRSILAEKAFHDALARRNDAQIAYLRQPSIVTRVAFEAAKKAEADALEILDGEVRGLASTRATTVIGLKLKAAYACTEGKLADSIVEDILQL